MDFIIYIKKVPFGSTSLIASNLIITLVIYIRKVFHCCREAKSIIHLSVLAQYLLTFKWSSGPVVKVFASKPSGCRFEPYMGSQPWFLIMTLVLVGSRKRTQEWKVVRTCFFLANINILKLIYWSVLSDQALHCWLINFKFSFWCP